MTVRAAALLLLAAALPGCATLARGTTQRLAVATSPPGAACGFYRHGDLVARVPATPGDAVVRRERQELLLLCVMPGRLPETAFLRSDRDSGRTADTGNLLLGAGPGWGIDIDTGADLRYDAPPLLQLQPDLARQPGTRHALPASLNSGGPPRPAEPLPTR